MAATGQGLPFGAGGNTQGPGAQNNQVETNLIRRELKELKRKKQELAQVRKAVALGL